MTDSAVLDPVGGTTPDDGRPQGTPVVEAESATEDDFLNKKRQTRTFGVSFYEGAPPKRVTIRKLSRTEYDGIKNAHPATPKQAREGQVVNGDTFSPAFLAEAVVSPKLSEQQWTEVWNSNEWGAGELGNFVREVENYSGESLDLTPFD